jgi:uncharacterized protein
LSLERIALGRKSLIEIIRFRGHENILGTHRNTLEITKDSYITKRADCIVGVSATKGCAGIDVKLAQWIRSGNEMVFVISVGNLKFGFSGCGSEKLELTNENELVLRRSDFSSPRTLAIRCDAAAIDIPREIVRQLQNKETVGSLEIFISDRPSAPNPVPKIEFV